MEQHTINERTVDTLVFLYDWHTRLFPNVIDGISDKDAQDRLNTKANHVAWIAGSLVHTRFEMANVLGVDLKQRSHELFKDFQGIKDGVTYPSLQEYREDWQRVSGILKEKLESLDSEDLAKPDPFEMPGQQMTTFESFAFMIDRESYCIGQIGLFRRLLGYEALKYPD